MIDVNKKLNFENFYKKQRKNLNKLVNKISNLHADRNKTYQNIVYNKINYSQTFIKKFIVKKLVY